MFNLYQDWKEQKHSEDNSVKKCTLKKMLVLSLFLCRSLMDLRLASSCLGVMMEPTRSEVDRKSQPHDPLTYNLESLYSAGWGQWVHNNFTSRISTLSTPNSNTSETQHFQSVSDWCHGCRGMRQFPWSENLSGPGCSYKGSTSISAFHTASDV